MDVNQAEPPDEAPRCEQTAALDHAEGKKRLSIMRAIYGRRTKNGDREGVRELQDFPFGQKLALSIPGNRIWLVLFLQAPGLPVLGPAAARLLM